MNGSYTWLEGQNGTYGLTGFNYSMSMFNRFNTLRLVSLHLNTYVVPVIIVVGLLGNALSIGVFMGTYLKRLSISVYLAALAASDTCYLLCLLVQWLEYVSLPIINTPGICQITLYFVYCSSFLSVWFVVCFTVERYIAICHPLKRPELCTSTRSKYVVVGITLASMVIYSCSLWAHGVVQLHGAPGNGQLCSFLTDFMTMLTVIKYTDTVIALIIPFLLIVALNIAIAYRIAGFYKRRQTLQAPVYRRAPRIPENIQASLYSRAQLKVTKMLLLLSSMFLLINLPSYAMRLRVFLKPHSGPNAEMYIQQIVQIMYYMNFSINFVLYSVFSTKFRVAFRRFWWKARYKMTRLIAIGVYRLFRREYSSSASGEQEIPAILPLRHHYDLNPKFYV